MSPQRERYKVDFMFDGEVLVRGTLDPMEALRIYVDRIDEGDDSCLWGVSPGIGEFDPEAAEDLACRLDGMLQNAAPGLYRKIHCLPGSHGYYEGWAWQLSHADKKGPGVFEAVYFRC